jgi:prepilin-type N-terminal cleavage/methylation domain-containing protein
MKRISSGFSMLEIMVVLLITGIIVAMVVPSAYNAMKGYKLHADATALASYLNVVRMKAASQYKPYRLAIDVSGGTYTMEKLCGDTQSSVDANCTGAYPAYQEFSTPVFEGGTQYMSQGNTFTGCRPSSITGALYPGTIQADPSPCPTTLYMYFNTRGSPVDNQGNPLGNGGDVIYIQNQNKLVDAVTVSLGGRVSVSTWSGSAWVVR